MAFLSTYLTSQRCQMSICTSSISGWLGVAGGCRVCTCSFYFKTPPHIRCKPSGTSSSSVTRCFWHQRSGTAAPLTFRRGINLNLKILKPDGCAFPCVRLWLGIGDPQSFKQPGFGLGRCFSAKFRYGAYGGQSSPSLLLLLLLSLLLLVVSLLLVLVLVLAVSFLVCVFVCLCVCVCLLV